MLVKMLAAFAKKETHPEVRRRAIECLVEWVLPSAAVSAGGVEAFSKILEKPVCAPAAMGLVRLLEKHT